MFCPLIVTMVLLRETGIRDGTAQDQSLQNPRDDLSR